MDPTSDDERFERFNKCVLSLCSRCGSSAIIVEVMPSGHEHRLCATCGLCYTCSPKLQSPFATAR
jgi:hypothetical protein